GWWVKTSWVGGGGRISKMGEVKPLRALAGGAVSLSPVAAVSMVRPLNVATPPLSVMLAVPRPESKVFWFSVRVTVVVLSPVSTRSEERRVGTAGAGLRGAPGGVGVGGG